MYRCINSSQNTYEGTTVVYSTVISKRPAFISDIALVIVGGCNRYMVGRDFRAFIKEGRIYQAREK